MSDILRLWRRMSLLFRLKECVSWLKGPNAAGHIGDEQCRFRRGTGYIKEKEYSHRTYKSKRRGIQLWSRRRIIGNIS